MQELLMLVGHQVKLGEHIGDPGPPGAEFRRANQKCLQGRMAGAPACPMGGQLPLRAKGA